MTHPSTLLFDQETLSQGIRVRPAQFARMCCVSRQAVSQWIAKGQIRLYPDGTLDPANAARELINNSDPLRLRAKVFKAAASDVGVLRKEIASLTERLEQANARIEFLEMLLTEDGMAIEIFRAMLIFNRDDISKADAAGFASLMENLMDESILAAGYELGLIDAPTGKPYEAMTGSWRDFFCDGMAFRGVTAPGEIKKGEGNQLEGQKNAD